jgi:putative transposase
MNKAFKFRIYPTEAQKTLIHMTLGHNRFLWNKMLEDKQKHYELNKTQLYNRPAQYKENYPFLKDVDSLSLANTKLNLEKAFRMFFKRKQDLPKFHSKKHDYGYTTNLVNHDIVLLKGYIKLPKLGDVKIKQHRVIPNEMTLKSVTVSKSSTSKYYVSILYEYQKEITKQVVKQSIGLNFSMNHFYVDDQGFKLEYPKDIQTDYSKLRILQRSLSRRIKGSSNYHKKGLEIALLHERIRHKRDDFLHKQSHAIAKRHDLVSVEGINLIEMSQDNPYYAKQVSRFGWTRFIAFLKYKLETQGKTLMVIDKWYPSSKTCSHCGSIQKTLKLSNRVFECPSCELHLDRDHNAAININKEGFRKYQFALSI